MKQSLKNIPLSDFKKFLEFKGLKIIRTTGGHEIWGGKFLRRPVVLQNHIDPVPEFIIRSNLRTLNSNKNELLNFLYQGKSKK